jgi:Tfp pilus assembly protein FimT
MKYTLGFFTLLICDTALMRAQVLTLPEALVMLALAAICTLYALFGLAQYMEETD